MTASSSSATSAISPAVPASSSSMFAASASSATSFFANSESDQEIILDGQDKSEKSCQIKIVQVKEEIFVFNGETILANFSAKKFSFEEVLDTFLQESGMRVSFAVPEAETSISRLDKTVSITKDLGCVTLILGKNNSTYGHAQLVFEAISKRHHAVWLTDIYLLNAEAQSLQGQANIRVLDLTGKELVVTSQTDTWSLATEEIQRKIEGLKKQVAAHEKVLFFKTGKGTRGVSIDGHNCLTWAQEVLEDLGIVLYKDVYNWRKSSENSRFWAKVYLAPSEEIRCDSIHSKRRVVVQIALKNFETLTVPKADVTRKIHEEVIALTKTPSAFWRTKEAVYYATAQSDQASEFSCCDRVKIPVSIRVQSTNDVIEAEIDVTKEVERQLNLPTVGCLNVERSAFDCDSIRRDLYAEREAARKALQFWNGNEILGKVWNFFGSFFDSSC